MMSNASDSHERFDELSVLYLWDALEASERTWVEQHLEGCEVCRDRFERDKELDLMISDSLTPGRAPDGLEGNVLSAFREGVRDTGSDGPVKMRIVRGTPWFWRAMRVSASLAAAFVLVVMGGMLTGEMLPRAQMVGGFAASRLKPRAVFESYDTGPVQDGVFGRDFKGLGDAERADPSAPATTVRTATPAPRRSLERGRSQAGKSLDQANPNFAYNLGVAAGMPQNKAAQASGDQAATAGKVESKRQLIYRATVSLEVDDLEVTYGGLRRLVESVGGFVAEAESTKASNGKRRGRMVLRVPPAKLQEVLTAIQGGSIYGEVLSSDVETDDVTAVVADLEARMRNKKRLEQRLLELLKSENAKVKDLLEAERELGRVREAIESMEARRRTLGDLVAMTTVTVSVQERNQEKPRVYRIERTAQWTARVESLESTEAKVRALIAEVEGRVLDYSGSESQSGAKHASLKLDVPAEAFAATVERLRSYGEVEHYSASRKERGVGGSGDGDASVKTENRRGVIQLALEQQGAVVAPNTFATTLRRTLSQSVYWIAWSVRMVVVSMGFLAPWALLFCGGVFVLRRRKKGEAAAAPKKEKAEG